MENSALLESCTKLVPHKVLCYGSNSAFKWCHYFFLGALALDSKLCASCLIQPKCSFQPFNIELLSMAQYHTTHFFCRFKIYGDFLLLLNKTTEFTLIKTNVRTIDDLEIMKFADDFLLQDEKVTHCLDDIYVCKPQVKCFFGIEIESLCYFTGESFFNLTQDVLYSVEEYSQAFEKLSESLQAYLMEWNQLNGRFYL